MTKGNISKKIILFAFPIFLGNLFQQLYNVVDSLVVGNVLGKEALAAVSSTGSLIFLIVGFINGIFVGASVIISRYFVEKLANKMLIFENSKVDLYPMPYKEYLELRERLNIERPIEKPKKEPKAPPVKNERKPNNTYKINALNKNIEQLEADLDRLTLEMEKNNDDADKLYQLYIEKENLENKLLDSYEELENLQ